MAKAAQRAEVHMKVPVYHRIRPADANTALVPPVLNSSADAEQLGLLVDQQYNGFLTQNLELGLLLEPPLPQAKSQLH